MSERVLWENEFSEEFELHSYCNMKASEWYEDEVELSLINCTTWKDGSPNPADHFSLGIGKGLMISSYGDLDAIKKEQRTWLKDPPPSGPYTLWFKPHHEQPTTNAFGFDYACITGASTSAAESDTAGTSTSDVHSAVGSNKDATGNHKHQHEPIHVQLFTKYYI